MNVYSATSVKLIELLSMLAYVMLNVVKNRNFFRKHAYKTVRVTHGAQPMDSHP